MEIQHVENNLKITFGSSYGLDAYKGMTEKVLSFVNQSIEQVDLLYTGEKLDYHLYQFLVMIKIAFQEKSKVVVDIKLSEAQMEVYKMNNLQSII